MNKIPIYKAVIVNNESGMVAISLVDYPATESDFLAFDKQKEMLKFAIENEEKRLVRGLVMAADLLIYRVNPQYGEYYIYYDANILRTMAERYLKNNFQNNVDLNHDGKLVEGVDMVQFFIKDTENGVNPRGFEDYADGSLFAEFHINNDEVWEQIKNGDFKGFSLAGFFGEEPTGENVEYSKQNNKDTNESKIMTKLKKVKEVLRSLLLEFGEVATDKGVLVWSGDEELVEGMEVRTVAEDETETPAPTGDYRTEDGKTIVVEDGRVVEIKDTEAEIAPENEENASEEQQPNEDENPSNEEPEIDEKDALIEELKAKVSELEAENAELKAKVEELSNEPAAPNAEEAFEKLNDNDNSKAAQLRRKGYKF